MVQEEGEFLRQINQLLTTVKKKEPAVASGKPLPTPTSSSASVGTGLESKTHLSTTCLDEGQSTTKSPSTLTDPPPSHISPTPPPSLPNEDTQRKVPQQQEDVCPGVHGSRLYSSVVCTVPRQGPMVQGEGRDGSSSMQEEITPPPGGGGASGDPVLVSTSELLPSHPITSLDLVCMCVASRH